VFALLMEMGTGKSRVVLEDYQSRCAGGLDNLFVLAPAGSYRNWFEDRPGVPSEITLHLDPELRRRLAVAVWGPKAAHRDSRAAALSYRGNRALFMNVEALSSGTKAMDYAKAFLATGPTMMVVDESTTIRGNSTRRKRVVKLGELAYSRRIASGLVSPKSPMDLFWQFWFLDWRILGMQSYVAFQNRYAEVDRICYVPRNILENKLLQRRPGAAVGAMSRDQILATLQQIGVYVPVVQKIREFKNLGDLQQKVAPYSYRVLKSDCLDLDPKTYALRHVDLTAEQARMYREIKQNAMTVVAGQHHVTATMVVTQMIRMHQVACGHVVDELGVTHDVPSKRIDEIVDLLGDHPRKAVVWVCYTHELQKVARRLEGEFGPRSVARYWGGNVQARAGEEASFVSDPECRFMVATQAAGGRGNNWTCADLVIYAANSYDLEMRIQSEDRCHRKGQKMPVTYVDLVAPGTVDERIIQSLRNKIDLAAQITGEDYREWLV